LYGDSAVDGHNANLAGLAKLFGLSVDLQDKFPSWSNDQANGPVDAVLDWLLVSDVPYQREDVGKGLATASLSDADLVSSAHAYGNRLTLNREWLFELLLFDQL